VREKGRFSQRERESFNAKEREKRRLGKASMLGKEKEGDLTKGRERHTLKMHCNKEERKRVMTRKRGGDLAEGKMHAPWDVLQQRRQRASTPRRKRESLNTKKKKEREFQCTEERASTPRREKERWPSKGIKV